MKNSYFLNKRDNIIYDFLINGKGSTKDLLEIINREISEIDPNKQIGLKTLQNDLAKVKKEVGEVEEYYPEGCDKRSPHIRFKYPQKISNSIGLTKSQKNSLIDSFVFLERFLLSLRLVGSCAPWPICFGGFSPPYKNNGMFCSCIRPHSDIR